MSSSGKKAQGVPKGAGVTRRASSGKKPSDARTVEKRSAECVGDVLRPTGRAEGRGGAAANRSRGGREIAVPAPIIASGQADEQFRLVQDVAKIGCWSWDIASGQATWSEGVYAIFKAPQEEPSYELARSFVHPGDLVLWESTIKAAIDKQEPFSLDYRAVRSDGETIWVHNETMPEFDGKGKLAGYRGTVQDVTGRRKAEEALRISEHFLHVILDGLTANVAVVDEQGTILFVNEAWRRFAQKNGIAPAAVSEGNSYLRVCDASLNDDAREARMFGLAIRRVLSGESGYFELEYPCHSPEEERWFVGRVTALRGETGPQALVAHENITERKRAEKELVEHRIMLRALASDLIHTEDRERRRLAAFLHDDVGQSLAAVRVKLATWKGTKSSHQRRRLLHEMEELLDETIDRTRALTFEVSPALLFELGLGPALEALGEKLFAGTGTAFKFHDDGLGERLQDTLASAIYRIGRELLVNALKHAQARSVSISLSVNGDHGHLMVKDDGIGMEQARHEKALNGRGGTYGLFSASELLHHSGGWITIDASPGRGTCVRVALPLSGPASPPMGDSS